MMSMLMFLQSLLFEFDPSARRDAVAIQVQRVQARECAAYSRVTKHGRSLGITVVCDVENRQIGETSVILGGTDDRLHAVDVNTYKAQVQPLELWECTIFHCIRQGLQAVVGRSVPTQVQVLEVFKCIDA